MTHEIVSSLFLELTLLESLIHSWFSVHAKVLLVTQQPKSKRIKISSNFGVHKIPPTIPPRLDDNVRTSPLHQHFTDDLSKAQSGVVFQANMRIQLIFILRKKYSFLLKNSALEDVIFVPLFLHLSTNRRFFGSFEILKYFTDENIRLDAKNLKDQIPK